MRIIRAVCPLCGEVDLPPEEVELRAVREGPQWVGPGSSYRFVCPDCGVTVQKSADEHVVTILLRAGVDLTVASETFTHPERHAGGPPLTWDDLLDLHLTLSDDTWFRELLSAEDDARASS